jgi:drug/metabolite transporter (DMT)-like permease
MTKAPEQRPLLALSLALAASASFSLVAMCVKELGRDATVGVAPPIFVRGVFGALLCVAWATWTKRSLRPSGWAALVQRCAAGVAAVGLYYAALGPGDTDMVTAAMLLKTSPLWVALLSAPLLGEAVSRRTWIGLAIGLAGVVLASLDPAKGWTPDLARVGVGMALASGVCSAFAYLALRKLARTDDPVSVVASFSVALALVSLPFVLAKRVHVGAWSGHTWFILTMAGVFGTAGQLFLTAAFRYGTASSVTVAGLSELGLQALLSIWRFGELPSRAELVGGLLCMAAGLIASPRVEQPAPVANALPTGLVDEEG